MKKISILIMFMLLLSLTIMTSVLATDEPATIVATKIICTDEADLPNWGAGAPNIDASTAQDWVDNHKTCHLASDWLFQWNYASSSYSGNPGDNTGVSSNWITFDPTDVAGVTTTQIFSLDDRPLWVREVMQTNFLWFTGVSQIADVSAEIYCHTDVLNYDNYERIDNPVYGGTYYCVAWNVPTGDTEVPEFGTLAGLAVLAMAGLFIYKKRK